MQFSELALSEPILRALTAEGYESPTPIQEQAILPLLEGRDLLATAQTGTGKTAAFALPILQRLSVGVSRSGIRALILTPTRELALQIQRSFQAYGRNLRVKSAVVVGGVPFGAQREALRRMPDVLVATPGRLLDLMNQGSVQLQHIEMFVLDEADRMLDMGFLPSVRRIIAALPKERQTTLFSATMEPEIGELARTMLRNPVRVEVLRTSSVPTAVDQRVMFVAQSDKRALLTDVLKRHGVHRALVFTRTKHRANRIAEQLIKEGISSDVIHANKSQNARQRALAAFSAGKVNVLVATDIVARGIDVDGISHVVNYEMPRESESYVHRIGRTARAGSTGCAISLCDAEEIPFLTDIERLTQLTIPADHEHAWHSPEIAELHDRANARRAAPQRRPQQQRNSGGGRPRRSFGR